VSTIKKRDYLTVKFNDWQPIKATLEAEYDVQHKERRLAELA
jgi:hypothetical protein